MCGLVGSADTGSEDLVRVCRSALASFCHESPQNTDSICATLLQMLEENIANDRILVPTLEVIGFLFDVQIVQQSQTEYVSPLDLFPMQY